MELRVRKLISLLLIVVFVLMIWEYLTGSLMIAVPKYDITHIIAKPLYSWRKRSTTRKSMNSMVSKEEDPVRADVNMKSSIISKDKESALADVNMTSSIISKEKDTSRAHISMTLLVISNKQDIARAEIDKTSTIISNENDIVQDHINVTSLTISNKQNTKHPEENVTLSIISKEQDTAGADMNKSSLISKDRDIGYDYVNLTSSVTPNGQYTSHANEIELSSTIANELMSTNGILNTSLCDEIPPNLGPVEVDKSKIDMKDIEKKYPEVESGGLYSPSHCTARHKVAIIVPYRDRYEQLIIFLNHMHQFLIKQDLDYGIFIIEQAGAKPFNRAKLMNVGFVESQKLKEGGWQCFILHDVDLLPLDTRNIYSCPKQPRHMSLAIDKWGYKDIYEYNFGGVSALTVDQFKSVNGFSNVYWGWGGEDDDMSKRLLKKHYHIAKYKLSIARYMTLAHKPSKPNPKRWSLLKKTSKNMQNDGLSTLVYKVVNITKHPLYTHILVNIDRDKK